MALGADDVETAVLHHIDEIPIGILHLRRLELGDAGAEFDVGPAAGHVRRDRHRTGLTRAGDDLRLALVVFRVEHVMRYAGTLEHA
jgi:hypothetical protein